MKQKKRKHLTFVVAFCLVCVLMVLAVMAPRLAPHDPLATDFLNVLVGPCETYPLGTDQVGRCIYSRLLFGARISLGMTFVLLGSVFVLGLVIGVTSGMAGGIIDTVIMRMTDTVLAFPDIIFAIAVVGMLGPGMVNTILALSVIWWTKYARLTRILVFESASKEYISAAIMAGAGKVKLVTHYIIPNIIPQLIVQLMLDIGLMMLSLAGLSFLGLGVQPPMPEWGNMLSEGREYMQTAPWLLIYPGLAIFVVVAAFNVLGDTVRDLLDPRQV